jgi:hypothetical protein
VARKKENVHVREKAKEETEKSRKMQVIKEGKYKESKAKTKERKKKTWTTKMKINVSMK